VNTLRENRFKYRKLYILFTFYLIYFCPWR